MDFTITSNQIMGFCSLVALIWGVWKIVKEIKKPSDDLKKLVDKHSAMLDNDNQRLKVIEESSKRTLQCLLIIINHDITGNGIEQMKEARNDLQEYLINR